jgi:MinD-like ATPase involved in chromosome partitioning or flagellar assembly
VTHTEPTVALVFSPETWVEELHRHLADHGGARVRQIVVEPTAALDEDYDALVVSDRWPALTRSFVQAVHARGRHVLGVFDPDEPAGKDHLVALGVEATIAGDAPVSEFVGAVVGLVAEARSPHEPTDRRAGAPLVDTPEAAGARVVVVSGPRGAGATEVAVTLATAAARHRGSVVLVDAHESAPAVAGRLGLGLEPNLRTAVDAHVHALGEVADAVVRAVATGFDVVSGFPSAGAAAHVTPREVLDVLEALRRSYGTVIVDLDSGHGAPIGRAVLGLNPTLVGVSTATPLGVVRLLEWVAESSSVAPSSPIHLVLNRAPRERFRRAEIASEICRALVPSTLVFVPTDRHVEDAGWNGIPVVRGPFLAGLGPLAADVSPPVPARWRQSGARRRRSAR